MRRQIPAVLLVIAGEGPARRRLEVLGRELGLGDNLLFVGYLSRDGALEDCYCAGDAFVFASRTETQGLVLLEAMALGLPVISTAVMGTREVLADCGGALVAEDDEADFAAKTVHLLGDLALRAHLAAQARLHAHAWSAPVLADRMLTFYDTVTKGSARADTDNAPSVQSQEGMPRQRGEARRADEEATVRTGDPAKVSRSLSPTAPAARKAARGS